MSPSAEIDVNSLIKPKKLAHVVLRTNNYEALVRFYKIFLGASVAYGNDYLCFLTYDEEHHRIAIAKHTEIGPKNDLTCGMDHLAFSYDTLSELVLAYKQRKAYGILPSWCTNHGQTTSMYYHDTDGNKIEVQVDNFETAEGANEFMRSEEFAQNPIGADFDPEEFVKRVESGESDSSIKNRPNVGPRNLPNRVNPVTKLAA